MRSLGRPRDSSVAADTVGPSPIESGTTYVVIATALWAGAFVAARVASGAIDGPGFDPFAVLSGRTSLAALAFVPAALAGKVGWIRRSDLPLMLLVAATGQWGYLLTYHLGAGSSSAATASLIVNLAPVIGTVAGVMILGDHLVRTQWLGVGLAVAGTIPVSLGDGGELRLNAAVLWLLAAAVCAGVYVVAAKPLVDRYGGLTVTAWGWWISAPCALPFAPRLIYQLPHASGAAIWALLYLGIGSSAIAYVAWGNGLARMTASAAAAWLFATPVVAVLAAWILLGEVPGPATLIGGSVALCGVWLATGRRGG